MFLDTVLTRNPGLVDAAAALHRNGEIPPDTYVVDLDAVEANAALLAAEAERLGISLWFVVKQLGRNPELIRAIARHIPRSAAIDPAEARTLHAAGAQPGNLGHLVQIPRRALPEMLAWRPETVTVFDLANARAVSDAARRLGFVQDILIRLEGADGSVYPGQEGGVPLDRLEAFAKDAEALDGIRIAGVTAFPCVLCDPVTGVPAATPNFGLALKARELLTARGHHGLKLSAPSATSMASLPLLAELGATHGEPGHALTGTTPCTPSIRPSPRSPRTCTSARSPTRSTTAARRYSAAASTPVRTSAAPSCRVPAPAWAFRTHPPRTSTTTGCSTRPPVRRTSVWGTPRCSPSVPRSSSPARPSPSSPGSPPAAPG